MSKWKHEEFQSCWSLEYMNSFLVLYVPIRVFRVYAWSDIERYFCHKKKIGDPKFKPVWVESQQNIQFFPSIRYHYLGSGCVACLKNMFNLTPTWRWYSDFYCCHYVCVMNWNPWFLSPEFSEKGREFTPIECVCVASRFDAWSLFNGVAPTECCMETRAQIYLQKERIWYQKRIID